MCHKLRLLTDGLYSMVIFFFGDSQWWNKKTIRMYLDRVFQPMVIKAKQRLDYFSMFPALFISFFLDFHSSTILSFNNSHKRRCDPIIINSMKGDCCFRKKKKKSFFHWLHAIHEYTNLREEEGKNKISWKTFSNCRRA